MGLFNSKPKYQRGATVFFVVKSGWQKKLFCIKDLRANKPGGASGLKGVSGGVHDTSIQQCAVDRARAEVGIEITKSDLIFIGSYEKRDQDGKLEDFHSCFLVELDMDIGEFKAAVDATKIYNDNHGQKWDRIHSTYMFDFEEVIRMLDHDIGAVRATGGSQYFMRNTIPWVNAIVGRDLFVGEEWGGKIITDKKSPK